MLLWGCFPLHHEKQLGRTSLPGLYRQKKKKKIFSLELCVPKRYCTGKRFVNPMLPSCNPAETTINKCWQQVGFDSEDGSMPRGHSNEL